MRRSGGSLESLYAAKESRRWGGRYFVWMLGFAGLVLSPRSVSAFSVTRPQRYLVRGSHHKQRMTSSLSAVTLVSNQTNRAIAEQRLQVFQAKRQARQKSVHAAKERNYHLKKVLYNETTSESQHALSGASSESLDKSNSNYPIPQMYQIKVLVCEELRIELKLTGREKRGRVFIEQTSVATTSLAALRSELHGFFRALKKGTFLLSAGYPATTNTTNQGTHGEGDSAENHVGSLTWPLECDDDVVETFRRADDFFVTSTVETTDSTLKRPSIVIHVTKDPNAPPPPPVPAYLLDLPDPSTSTHMTMLSFYAFPPNGIAQPDDYSVLLRKLWKPFAALGRVYVAQEGVNAQMSVPTLVLPQFIECCNSLPDQVGSYLQANGGINVDPIPLTRDEFAVAGIPAAGIDGSTTTLVPPFTNLHIRVRQQVVTDGLDRTYDWQNAGYDMPALEWHQKLREEKERRERGDDSSTPVTILDCRNSYETDIGKFVGSEPLQTETFRESWDALKERLAETPKDAPIMTYCTGGIRCVKIGAYLTQELGFTNVARLAGGIIAYDRTLNEKAPEEEALFKGTNFVFDGRLGRTITEDSLGSCMTCGSETSAVSNCRNENCHKRMVQCETCRTNFAGTCSDACHHRLVNGAMRPRRNSYSSSSASSTSSDKADEAPRTPPTFKSLDEYSTGHSSPLPFVYAEMELNTRALIPSGSHMVSGSAQGRLLTQLASMTREGRVLELGTFTGYATACLLEGAANAGRAINVQSVGSRATGPYVLTMERDSKAFDVAVAQLKVVSEYGTGESAAEAMCALRSIAVASVVEDSVSLPFDGVATCELLRVSDALAVIEEMAAGRGSVQVAPFDMIFLDADKTRLLDYAEAFLSSDRLLKPGGLIVVDNVLWKGLVLEASTGAFSSLEEFADSEEAELRKNRRARKLANKMHRFNSEIVKDQRVDVLVLPMRDGLSVIRKK